MAKLGRMEKRVMLGDRHAEESLKRLEGLLPHVDLEGRRDMLELGCGGGHVSRFMRKRYGMQVTATDVDPDMVRHAQERSRGLEGIRFAVADATRLEYGDASFDLAVSIGILHHINAWAKVVSEVHRVLRPGGVYVLGDIAFSRPTAVVFRPLSRSLGIYTIGDLVGRAGGVGFEVVHRSGPKGMALRYHALVLSKGAGVSVRPVAP
jgi:ubiquinone/menaquinone biosynthesis C-methylase UbiE